MAMDAMRAPLSSFAAAPVVALHVHGQQIEKVGTYLTHILPPLLSSSPPLLHFPPSSPKIVCAANPSFDWCSWSCIGDGGGVAVGNAVVVVTRSPWRLAVFVVNECLRVSLLWWNPMVVRDDTGDNLVTQWPHSPIFDVDEDYWQNPTLCTRITRFGNTASLPMWNHRPVHWSDLRTSPAL